MGVYFSSTGDRFTQAQVDRRIRKAKQDVYEMFWDEHGREPFCQDCGRNDCLPVDMSHDTSVQECKNMGQVELAWSTSNITPRGRKCHQKRDGLNLQFGV